MPYEVRKVGDKFCVYKESGGESLGCHDTEREAERQKTAILISEHASTSKSLGNSNELRLGLLITSNAYADRQHEIVRQKALEDWVDRAWNGEEFIVNNPLLFWHDGDPTGDIIYAATQGPFLVEVARERPDAVINLMPPGSPPVMASIKGIWDAAAQLPIQWGASHEFLYRREDIQDGEYEQIVKTESTWLPRQWAANAYTLFMVL